MSRYNAKRCGRVVTGTKSGAPARKRTPKMLHLSAPLVRVKDPETGISSWRVLRPGRTYRNATRVSRKKEILQ